MQNERKKKIRTVGLSHTSCILSQTVRIGEIQAIRNCEHPTGGILVLNLKKITTKDRH